MNKSLDNLPEPNLKGVKISILKKQKKDAAIRIDYLDGLLDKKFLKEYFQEKITKEYINVS